MRSRRGAAPITLARRHVDLHASHGGDPFGYGPLPATMTRAEVLERTVDTDYPDAPLQVAQVFDSPRAGDFLVSATPRLRSARRAKERVEHRSCHGSLHREHMRVPFAINAPDRRSPRRARSTRSRRSSSCSGEETPAGIDGRSLLT